MKNKDKIRETKNIVYHQSAGGFLFYKNKNKLYVAMLKRKDDGYYIPKGHITDGEQPLEAAIREIKEELNLKVKPVLVKKLGINKFEFELPDDARLHKKKVYLFVFNVVKKLNIKPEEGVYENADWLEVSKAKDLMQFDKQWLDKAIKLFQKVYRK